MKWVHYHFKFKMIYYSSSTDCCAITNSSLVGALFVLQSSTVNIYSNMQNENFQLEIVMKITINIQIYTKCLMVVRDAFSKID